MVPCLGCCRGGIGTWPEEGAQEVTKTLLQFGTNSLRVCLKELGCLS